MRGSSTIDNFINLTRGRQREAMKEKNTEKKTQNKVEISLKNILVYKKMKRIFLTYDGPQKHNIRSKNQAV